MPLSDVLTEKTVIFNASASDWKEAVKIAGSLLEKTGAVEHRYIDAMIRTVEELGPYSVITPGIALPHAGPNDGAKRAALSLVILGKPVNFGSHNDPVKVVIAFSSPNPKAHINMLKELAELLSDKTCVAQLKQAKSKKEILQVIASKEKGT